MPPARAMGGRQLVVQARRSPPAAPPPLPPSRRSLLPGLLQRPGGMGKTLAICRRAVLLPGELLPERFRAPGRHHVRAVLLCCAPPPRPACMQTSGGMARQLRAPA